MSNLPDSLHALNIEYLRANLPANDLGLQLIYEPIIASTNSLALSLLDAGAKHGAVILTDAQPEGRGRQGRTWITLPKQQILLSVVLAVPFPPHWLVMAAAVSVLDAVQKNAAPEHIAIKWPNDVHISGKKIGGILIETRSVAPDTFMAVVGIGLNVNGSLSSWPEVNARATTLSDVLGRELLREPLILDLLANLGNWHQRLQNEPLAAAELWNQWRNHISHLGQSVQVHLDNRTIAGIAEDVADDGALLVRLPDGSRQVITWGDVEMISS